MQRAFKYGVIALAALVLGSCGGGGGECSPADCPPPEQIGVSSGFTGDLNWDTGGDGSGGVGGGASGDGGVGAGGDFGQFRGAIVTVYLQDGTKLGEAVTDNEKGMVTIRPGRAYRGMLRLELRGAPGATYYEEGRNEFVPFPADRMIRAWVPAINKNIGLTPFTEAAYRLLTEGSTAERVNGTPNAPQVRAANNRVRGILNAQFPTLLQVDDITRLPFIKSPAVAAGAIGTDPRGRYGLVNGAFSKQAAQFNGDRTTPTLDATRQLSEDLLDGQLDGRNGNAPAAPVGERTYEPNTLTGELSSALAEQATRFGSQQALDTLPPVLNFGNTRYQGYLFDGSVTKDGKAYSTVAGWVAGNSLGLQPGEARQKLASLARTFGFVGNMGHGGGFFKGDAVGTRPKVYALGDNVNGELGLGDRNTTAGQAVELTLPGALTHVAGGFAHTVARLADGSVWAWGDNGFGQLGAGQDATALPRALTPQQVTLPAGAVAVAATNLASYALLDNGSVWAWGSNGGFGLLGNGAADGVATAPVQVAGLADVVQIVARDNDVVVLRRDNTVWQWGSHPADPSAFVPGNVGAPYIGGNRTPVQAPGLPAGVAVRKILTEQGLFAALLANGQVYTWGVYFDITAGNVLRDLGATRVLGLPPLRDMMPGGYIGYGVRPFDRLTSMGVDYSGGMWKIRGRVAEGFDPAKPAAQRRPQGQAPRADCVQCHVFLDASVTELLAQAPSTAGMAVCAPPANVHQSGGASLIHVDTDCVQCHNPARLGYPALNPAGTPPFASTGGWPNCIKPTNLPQRGSTTPPVVTNSCALPPGHSYTPPGTVCASCHNDIIARALQSLSPPCAQPQSSELPSIATSAAIAGAFNDLGLAIAAGSLTADATPELRGTLSAALASGQSLAVLRNGTPVGSATVSGTAWTYTDSGAADGPVSYTSRVVAGSAFGRTSNALAFSIDATPPSATASITNFVDDVLGTIAPGAFATDTTPGISGSLGGTLGAGESVRVLRNGVVAGTASVSGSSWSFTEPNALAAAAYSYQARVVDSAGNLGALSAAAQLRLIAGLPAATIVQAVNDLSAPIASGSATTDSTPAFSGTLDAPLQPGYVLRVFRNAAAIGNATVSGTNWNLTDPGAPDGSHNYQARVEAGAVQGALSGSYLITVDTVPPTQAANVTLISDDFNGALANNATTADTTPIVSGTLSAPLAAGEQLRVLRNGTLAATIGASGTVWIYTEPSVLPSATYTYQARVVDAAAQLGPLGATRVVTVDAAGVPLQNAATTLATINGVVPVANAVAQNNVRTPLLAGTIQRALNAGEVVRIYRGGAPVGTATVSGTAWTYTNSSLADGTYTFRAQIEVGSNPAIFGATSATVTDPIDGTPPTQTATLVSISDDSGALVNVTDTFSTDTTPRLDGTLNAALATGDFIRIIRSGAVVGTIRPTGTAWSYVDSAVGLGAHTYTVDIRDDAGNIGTVAAGPTRSVTVILASSLPSATITNAAVSGTGSPGKPNGTAVASGQAIPDSTPTLTIALSAALPTGYQVQVLQAGTPIGTPFGCVSPCSFTTPVTADGSRVFSARTIAGPVLAVAGNSYTLEIDTVAPGQTTSITQVRSDRSPGGTITGATPPDSLILNNGQTNDSRPTFRIVTSTALAANESFQVRRGGTVLNSSQATFSFADCGPNCREFDADTAVTIIGTGSGTPDPSILPAPSPTIAFQTMGTAVYTVRVVDSAGWEGPATPNYTINVGYFLCDQVRANVTHRARVTVPPTPPTDHSLISAAANPTNRCIGCHVVGNGHPAFPTGTAAGHFVAVPQTFPSYWCRRPG